MLYWIDTLWQDVMWVKGYAVALRIPMSGRDFEELLAELFGRLGFDVELTPSANDYGADLILRFPSRIQHAIAVQAKFYSAPVDNSPVQEVLRRSNITVPERVG